jgi:cbb3-type cytochrome oxidase cytochrome c subunit
MKSSAVVFLAAFIALSASWGGFVLAPQLQLGRAPQAKAVPYGQAYPVARDGVAQQGAEVYRSLGCVYCHSQQVGQEHTKVELILTEAGTNETATVAAVLEKLNPALPKKIGTNESPAEKIVRSVPALIMTIRGTDAAADPLGELKTVGAKGEAHVTQTGSDLARGWGRRGTVATDLLFENPVQPGTRRIGPDLANVGARLSDMNWHLRHLYAPATIVPGSTMPAYRFLFEKKKITGRPSADAVVVSGDYQVVPTEAARALAAYLVSLRSDTPLFEAPFTAPAPPEAVAPATNAPATNAPAK